ncbi:MAG: extracellular solute-binding protein, partial [Nitrososphaeraceae archaeon]
MIIVIIFLTNFFYAEFIFASSNNETIELKVICDDFDGGNFTAVVDNGVKELKTRHPDLNIEINYTEYPYAQTHQVLVEELNNQNKPPDVICLDQIWLGEFASKRLLTDLTDNMMHWNRSSDWYQANLDGMQYNNRIYGIWAWTDIRGIWYWKDLLNEVRVDPNQLETWDGYITAAKRLNEALRPKGIEGVHLTGASHSPDLW